jgi:hypothetical protein
VRTGVHSRDTPRMVCRTLFRIFSRQICFRGNHGVAADRPRPPSDKRRSFHGGFRFPVGSAAVTIRDSRGLKLAVSFLYSRHCSQGRKISFRPGQCPGCGSWGRPWPLRSCGDSKTRGTRSRADWKQRGFRMGQMSRAMLQTLPPIRTAAKREVSKESRCGRTVGIERVCL